MPLIFNSVGAIAFTLKALNISIIGTAPKWAIPLRIMDSTGEEMVCMQHRSFPVSFSSSIKSREQLPVQSGEVAK